MRLAELVKYAEPLLIKGDADPEITGLYYDSRKVGPGGLFFALKGVASDGHSFIGKALENGAAAVVLEDEQELPPGIVCIKVSDSRMAMARMAAGFYRNPSASFTLIGITGTNGKTTTTYIIEGILEKAGLPTAVMGTIAYRFGEKVIPAPNTTPESVDLQRTLREFADMGSKCVVMEVSSHALDQKRVDGSLFDAAVFTNLTREHLDYHKNMEAYLESKKRLFSDLLIPDAHKPRRHAVVNIDDPLGHIIARASKAPVVSYGLVGESRVSARNISFTVSGISGILATPKEGIPFHSKLLGRFNLYNILAAASVAVALDISPQAIQAGIEGHTMAPGRLEPVPNEHGVTLLVDYAHTDDALENVLKTLTELAQRRIITVFGCGGDRDRGKRPIMGEIAGRYSDLTIITSDNPRTEDPLAIIEEIRTGVVPLGLKEYQANELPAAFGEKGFAAIVSRREAIRLAVRFARPGDIVLLAGKGHEDYQIIGAEKQHFDDREEAAEAFSVKGN